MYLLPIKHPEEDFPETDCWQPYAISADEDGDQCDFLDEIRALDQAYVDDFFAWLLHFLRLCKAHPKRPMKELIRDSKKLHEVGSIRLESSPGVTQFETVWQFTHGRLRILWCYASDGRILILGRILLKKTQKTKKSDLEAVQKALQKYLDATGSGLLKIVARD